MELPASTCSLKSMTPSQKYFLRACCCVSLSLLLAALSGSMRQSAADGVLESKDAISISKIFRSIDLAFLLQPAVSGERAVVTWSSKCSLLIELPQGFIPATPDMRSAAVELCVRVAQCWSPPPKKSQPEKGLRLASLRKEPPVQRPLLPNVSSAGQVPHAALAALVAHLLAVGELYAAATCVHSLHVGGNEALPVLEHPAGPPPHRRTPSLQSQPVTT